MPESGSFAPNTPGSYLTNAALGQSRTSRPIPWKRDCVGVSPSLWLVPETSNEQSFRVKTALLVAGSFVGGLLLGCLIMDDSPPVDARGSRGAISRGSPQEAASAIRSDTPGQVVPGVQFEPGQSPDDVLKITRGVLRDTNPRRRLRNFLLLLDGLTKENASAIASAFTSWPDDGPALPEECQSMFFQCWGEVAREEAYRSARESAAGSDAWVGDLINGWGQVDRAGIERFIATLPQASRERDLVTVAFGKLLATVDLKEAGAFALREMTNETESSRRFFKEVVDQAAREQRTDLLTEWFGRAPESALKSSLASNTVEALRTKSTDEAVTFLSNIGDAKWRDWNMYWRTAGDFAKRDPKGALEWIFSLPKFPDEPAPPGLASVVQQWHAKDPAAARDWLLQNVDQQWWPRAARGILDSLNRSGNAGEGDAFLSGFSLEAQKLIHESAKNPKPLMGDSR